MAKTTRWTGLGANDNFSTSGNWDNGVPVAGDTLEFAGSTRLTPNNDIAADTAFADITFIAAAGAFVIGGNRFELSGTLTNSSSNTQTINNNIIITATRTFLVNAALTLNGVISGTNGKIDLTGTNTLTLAGNNSFTGGVDISNNTNRIFISHVNALGTGTLTVNYTSISTGANGGLSTLTDLSAGVPNNIVISSGAYLMLGGNNASWPMKLTGIISGTGDNGIVKAQAYGLTLSGANTWQGPVRVYNGYISVASLNKVTGGSSSSNLGAPSSVTNGTIHLGGPTNAAGKLIYTGTGEITDRVINMNNTTSGCVIDMSGSGALVFTSAFTATGSGAKALTLQGLTAGTGEIQGAIVDSAGGATSLIKAETGKWTVSGTDPFTGTISVNAGTLLVNGPISGTGAVTVASGATLGGGGSIAGAISVSSGGILDPGTATGSTGVLSTANVTFNSTSEYKVDLNGSPASNGKILSSGTVALGAAANTLTVESYVNYSGGWIFTIIEASSLTGTFNGLADGATFTVSGRTLRINYTATTVILTDITPGQWFLSSMKNELYNTMQCVNGAR